MYAYLHLVLRQQGWYSLNYSFKSNINIKKIRRRRLRHRNHRCSVAYGTEKKSSLKTVPRVLWQERCEDHVLVQMLNVWRQLSGGVEGGGVNTVQYLSPVLAVLWGLITDRISPVNIEPEQENPLHHRSSVLILSQTDFIDPRRDIDMWTQTDDNNWILQLLRLLFSLSHRLI